MKIKIKQCSVNRYWYSEMIGKEFPLVNNKVHEVKEDNEKSNKCYTVIHENKEHVVLVNDCEVI